MISRKGQEEMVGFVMIVVIVAVVMLVFLGIMIRQTSPSEMRESKEVQAFLSSALEFTSECETRSKGIYQSVGELTKDCYEKKSCLSGEGSCTVLKRTLDDMLNKSWLTSEEGFTKGYVFNSSYIATEAGNSTLYKPITLIASGNCSFSIRGAESLLPAFPGKIMTSLQICY